MDADLRTLDSNVYIRALRDRDALRRLKRYVLRAGGRLHVSAVAALELRAGAITRPQQHALEDLLAAYISRGRCLVPSFDAFVQAGRVLSALAAEGYPVSQAARSFTNDVLLATSCRESEATLVTDNLRDFRMIQRHVRGFRVVDADAAGV